MGKGGAGAPVLQECGGVETLHQGGRTEISPLVHPSLTEVRGGGGSIPLDAQSAGVVRGQPMPSSVWGQRFRRDEPWPPPHSVHSEGTSASDPHAVTSSPHPALCSLSSCHHLPLDTAASVHVSSPNVSSTRMGLFLSCSELCPQARGRSRRIVDTLFCE